MSHIQSRPQCVKGMSWFMFVWYHTQHSTHCKTTRRITAKLWKSNFCTKRMVPICSIFHIISISIKTETNAQVCIYQHLYTINIIIIRSHKIYIICIYFTSSINVLIFIPKYCQFFIDIIPILLIICSAIKGISAGFKYTSCEIIFHEELCVPCASLCSVAEKSIHSEDIWGIPLRQVTHLWVNGQNRRMFKRVTCAP